MIYQGCSADDAIRQGDIFQSVPRVEPNLRALPVTRGSDLSVADWLEHTDVTPEMVALVAMRPVTAIVITQDCDAVRAKDIALCEIAPFAAVEPSAGSAKHPKGTMSLITKHARLNLKWFYLPPDPGIGLAEKMAVDFQSVLRVPREYLVANVERLRVGRLNAVACEHFRERLSEYFRRYAYDEWYPLDAEELEAYSRSKPEPIEPYPWQSPSAGDGA